MQLLGYSSKSHDIDVIPATAVAAAAAAGRLPHALTLCRRCPAAAQTSCAAAAAHHPQPPADRNYDNELCCTVGAYYYMFLHSVASASEINSILHLLCCSCCCTSESMLLLFNLLQVLLPLLLPSISPWYEMHHHLWVVQQVRSLHRMHHTDPAPCQLQQMEAVGTTRHHRHVCQLCIC
jgi:hypothetical protein